MAHQAGREHPKSPAPDPTMSWKVEITGNASSQWSTNSVRFATKEEAEAYGRDLAMRLVSSKVWRVSQSADPPNFQLAYDLGLVRIED
jgi:hypothetical protein